MSPDVMSNKTQSCVCPQMPYQNLAWARRRRCRCTCWSTNQTSKANNSLNEKRFYVHKLDNDTPNASHSTQ